MAGHKSYDILGVRVDALSMAEATEQIVTAAAKPNGPACYVVKPYVEFLHRGGRDQAVTSILNAAWLSLPDSVSTQWATTYLYGSHGGRRSGWRAFGLLCTIILRPPAIRHQVPEKFGGTIFTWQLLEAAAARDLSVYLIGSPNSGDIARTVAAIHQSLPSLRVVGSWPGKLDGKTGTALRQALPSEPVERELLADLKAHQPDLILVGMGFPLQEILMAKLVPQLKHGVLIGEGGTFDYDSFGGRRRKAPSLLQHVGLEWLWRLMLEPKRAGRQLAVPRFIWEIYRDGGRKPE